jgi:hypothetical protein
MQHGNIRTFLKHYQQRLVSADTAASHRGLEPQKKIMRAACTMSRWIDPDRPWRLTTEQSLSVNNDPYIRSLLERREKLKHKLHTKGRATDDSKYIKLSQQIHNEKQRLRDALLIHIQDTYDKEEPGRVIERQLSGVTISKDSKPVSYFSEDTLPEQRRLVELVILAPPGRTYKEEVQRRNNAINAVTAYCKIEEGQTGRGQRCSTGRAKGVVIKKEKDTQPAVIDSLAKALDAAMLSVFTEERPRICFLCLGNERLPLSDRVYTFGTSGDLTKHFKRKHLSVKDEEYSCGVCKISLDHQMHLRRHAVEIHGTVS